MLYETLNPWAWRLASHSDRGIYERAAELLMKRGFDAGVEHQKTASPPPKARQLGLQLVKERLAWAEKKRAAREALQDARGFASDLIGTDIDELGAARQVTLELDEALAALGDVE